MKNILYLVSLFAVIFSSCQMGNSIGSCPDFKGETQHVMRMKKPQKKVNKKKAKPQKEKKDIDLLVGNLNIEDIISQIINTEKASFWLAPDSTCPAIVLRDRSVIYAEVVKIEKDSLYLQYCDSTQQTFSLSTKQVHKIEYDEDFDPKQEQEVFIEKERDSLNNLANSDLEQAKDLGKLALGLGLGALLLPFLGIPALILANKSLKIYKQYPDYKEGRGFAIAGKILGVIFVVYLLIFALLLFILLSIQAA